MSSRLPNGWLWTKIGDIASVDGGLTKNAAKRAQSHAAVPLLSVAAVKLRKIDISAIGTIGLLDSDGNKGTLLPNDVLVVEGNGSLAHIGRVALWDLDIPNARHQNHLIRIRATQVEPRLLLEWLASPKGRSAIIDKATTAAGLYTLSLSKIESILVPLPPLNEQRRIVAKIEALLERSQRARQALDAIPPFIDKLRQSILAAAFRGDLTADWRAQNPDVEPAESLLQRIRAERRLRWEQAYLDKLNAKGQVPKDDRWKERYGAPAPAVTDDLPTLPASWAWVRVEELATKVVDGVHKKPSYVPTGIPFLTVKNLTAGPGISFDEVNYITPRDHEEYIKRTDPELGDILISKDGTLGVTRLVTTDRVFSIFVSLALVKPVLREMGPFLELAFQSPIFQERFVRTGSGLQHIHLRDLRNAVLPVAPLAEQVELVRRVGVALARIAAFEDQFKNALQALPGLEQAILAKAFRGELVPQDPGDEPASVLLERIRAARQSTPSTKRGKRARSAEPAPTAPARPRARSARPRPEPAHAPEQKTAPAPEPAPEPTAKPEPTHKNAPAPGPAQTTLPLGLADQDPETIQDALYAALWGRGSLALDTAVRTVAGALRDQGLVHYNKLRADGALYAAIKKAIDTAVRAGQLDRPTRGHVRAVAPNARDYTTDDWRMALLAALDSDSDGDGNSQPVARDQAIARAAAWARDNMGLAFKRLRAGGVIESGIKSAINSAIRRGELERINATHIRRCL